jgi:hypothetical protein
MTSNQPRGIDWWHWHSTNVNSGNAVLYTATAESRLTLKPAKNGGPHEWRTDIRTHDLTLTLRHTKKWSCSVVVGAHTNVGGAHSPHTTVYVSAPLDTKDRKPPKKKKMGASHTHIYIYIYAFCVPMHTQGISS